MKRGLKIFFLLVYLTVQGWAQDSLKVPSFVRLEHNRLFFGSDSSAFVRLFGKMQNVNSSQLTRLTVVHIGGSHVQAGVWSGTFASDLQYNFKTAGGGYFGFPYKLAKTNGQYFLSSYSTGKWKKCRAVSVDFCLPLGLSGLSVANNDSSCTFGVALREKAACRYFNNIRVYHNFNPSFEFSIRTAAGNRCERRDNVQGGYSLFSFDMPLDSVLFDLSRKDTLQKDFILYGFSLENDLTSGVYLAALGLNGASSASFLRCSEFTRQLPSLSADLYVLSLGVNDTQAADFSKEVYMSNYDSLINMIRSVDPDAAILLTTTTDNYIRKKTLNKRTDLAREAMFELATRNKVAVWDMFTVMGGPKSIVKWGQAGLAQPDRVHFNTRGYIMLGHLMFQALNNSWLQFNKVNPVR